MTEYGSGEPLERGAREPRSGRISWHPFYRFTLRPPAGDLDHSRRSMGRQRIASASFVPSEDFVSALHSARCDSAERSRIRGRLVRSTDGRSSQPLKPRRARDGSQGNHVQNSSIGINRQLPRAPHLRIR
jgi:hypothetical protein